MLSILLELILILFLTLFVYFFYFERKIPEALENKKDGIIGEVGGMNNEVTFDGKDADESAVSAGEDQCDDNADEGGDNSDGNKKEISDKTTQITASVNENVLKPSVSKKPMREYNILLLGETGAGKSTTINALANYMKYSTFEEAIDNDFAQLISTEFPLPDPKTGQQIVIKSGSDDNESGEISSSRTKSPIGHIIFKSDDCMIRIIDTPGIGDTRGADIDRKNFDEILKFLHFYKDLHGICILVKMTDSRKTTSFRYCINELLTHLHKSACKNIVFCFTFSRNSFYGPGDGYATLNNFLQSELKEVGLSLKKENCFFIDNEAFRFLVAKKNGYIFKEKQQDTFKDSWDNSVEQTANMMERILNLVPHNLAHTSSLNNARKLIIELAEPMVRLQENSDYNIKQLKAEQLRLKTSNETKENLARSLHIEVDDLESHKLEKPSTVCTAEKCVEVVKYQDKEKIHYKTRCHVGCDLKNIEPNQISHQGLRRCWAMSDTNVCVKECGCSWQTHMHLCYEFERVKRTIVDVNKEREFLSTQEAIDEIEAYILRLQELVSQYQEEMKVIQEVSSKFAYILTTNSNTPYNRFLEPYLNLMIDEETKKINAIPGYSRDTRDSLEIMRKTHTENVRILSEAIASQKQNEVRIEDIALYRDQLFSLTHSGPQFEQMMGTVQISRDEKRRATDRDDYKVLASSNKKQKKTNILKKIFKVSSASSYQYHTDPNYSFYANRIF